MQPTAAAILAIQDACVSVRTMATRDEYVRRFWSKVDKNGTVPTHRPELGQCWLWTAGCIRGGYGSFRWFKVHTKAHRLAYELTHGPIPDHMLACHACDVRNCCNPAHIWLGSTQQNTADMVAKNRQATGDAVCMRKYPEKRPRGTRNANARLSEEQVRAIRSRHLDRGETQTALAREFDIHQTCVSALVRGHTWAHVTSLPASESPTGDP